MPTDYQSAVHELYELGHELARTPSHKFDLAHMRVLLRALGDPQQRFRSVLIAGTNGKGSTAATLASILHAAGHRTGLYTSPHLVRINERIRVAAAEISDLDFSLVFHHVEEAAQRLVAAGELPWHPSFFEMLTAMAFLHFASAGIETAVLEVGMGGRLDATNVVEPVLSLITDISLDHQRFLGNTIAEIALEKAGIIHPGGAVILLPQHPEANDVLGKAVEERAARAISAVPYMPPLTPQPDVAPHVAQPPLAVSLGGSTAPDFREGHGLNRDDERSRNEAALTAEGMLANRYSIEVMGRQITVDSPLCGRHQVRNLALAIAAAVELNQQGIAISAADIERGIRDTRWPGRAQTIAGSPQILLDVAHNPAGAWALRALLSARFAGDETQPPLPITLVFGIMRDKAVGEVIEILFPLADRVIATRADNPRSASPEEIAAAAARTGADVTIAANVGDALDRARTLTPAEGVIVVTGSIYVVGEALRSLQQRQ